MSNSPASLRTPTTVNDGVAAATNTITSTTDTTSDSSPSSTIFIIIIVMASVILILALTFILIRILHILRHRTTSPPAETRSRDDRINSNCYNNRNIHSPESILDSLPLFSYNTVTGNLTGGDCAVCLSKFEGDDQLRLLPLCCHAFHARCIDTWLSSHMTCPLCRSSANPTESDLLDKILTTEGTRSSMINSANGDNNIGAAGRSFRLEIGSVSNRRSSAADSARRSYSIGEFEYIVNDGCEISVDRTHRRSLSELAAVDDQKEVLEGVMTGAPHGERLAEEVSGGRSWLRDYVDRLGSLSFSTRTLSIRSSGRFFTGSSRRSDVVLAAEDLEAHRMGEEISEMFRWLSGA